MADDVSKEVLNGGHSEEDPQSRLGGATQDHFVEKASAFLDKLQRVGLFSHIAAIRGRDDSESPFVDLYVLPKRPIDPDDQQQGKRLQTVLNSFNDFAYAIRTNTFVYLHLLDPTKYDPEQLEQALRAQCQNGVKLVTFEPIS